MTTTTGCRGCYTIQLSRSPSLSLSQLCGDKFHNTQPNANKQINTQLFRISLHECTFCPVKSVSAPQSPLLFFSFLFLSFLSSYDAIWRCVKLSLIGEYKGISSKPYMIVPIKKTSNGSCRQTCTTEKYPAGNAGNQLVKLLCKFDNTCI